jgi:regulator of replication initiation timing
MLENIKLYHDNEKLIIENSRLKNRLKELEVLHIGNIEKHMVKESVDYTAILIVKNGFKN